MDQNYTSLREDFDRILLLLACDPRPGFEAEFDELTRREVDRLLRSEPQEQERAR